MELNDIWLAISSVVTVASIIARYTKWTWDDTIVGYAIRLLSIAPKKP